MKVLMINGSPKPKGCIAEAFTIMAEEFAAAGIECEVVQVGNKDIRGCIACSKCRELGKCVFDKDIVNECASKLREADGLVIGSPVYFGNPNGTVPSLMRRPPHSSEPDLRMRVGAYVASARRDDNGATFEVLKPALRAGGDARGLARPLAIM
jgi:multimeric flavodoxin WrbA